MNVASSSGRPVRAPLRVAVAGMGFLGRIHARNAQQSTELDLVAVVSSDSAHARACAEELGHGVVPKGWDDLFETTDVDAVIVASQTVDHVAHARRVLAAGRHLFLEKPGALTLAEHAVVHEAAANARDAVVAVGYMRRYDECYAGLKRAIDAGAVGTPRFVSLAAREVEAPPALLRSAGGFIVDVGVHDFDVAAWLLGQEPVEAYALTQRTAGSSLSFDGAVVVVKFDQGGIAHVHLSCTSTAGHDLRCEVVGSLGSIAIGGASTGVGDLVPVDATLAGLNPQDFSTRFADALRTELDAFAARCFDPSLGGPGLDSDWRALATGVAARASAESGQPRRIGPDWPWNGPM